MVPDAREAFVEASGEVAVLAARAALAGLVCLLLATCTGGGQPGRPARPASAAPSLKLTVISIPLNCQPVADMPDGCQVGGSGLAGGLGKVRVYATVRLGLPRPAGSSSGSTTCAS
jgi:hypothetical protein